MGNSPASQSPIRLPPQLSLEEVIRFEKEAGPVIKKYRTGQTISAWIYIALIAILYYASKTVLMLGKLAPISIVYWCCVAGAIILDIAFIGAAIKAIVVSIPSDILEDSDYVTLRIALEMETTTMTHYTPATPVPVRDIELARKFFRTRILYDKGTYNPDKSDLHMLKELWTWIARRFSESIYLPCEILEALISCTRFVVTVLAVWFMKNFPEIMDQAHAQQVQQPKPEEEVPVKEPQETEFVDYACLRGDPRD